MPDRSSFTDRQAAYAAWRDRLREKDVVIDLDEEEPKLSDEWSPDALFAASREVEDGVGETSR